MKNELRVLHVITRLIVGGAQENTVASVLGLRGRPNLSVRLICGPSRGSEGSLAGEFAARCTTHFVSVAEAMTRQYLAAGIGRPEQFTRIWSGFDLEPFLAARNDLALRARFGIAPDDFVIAKLARLTPLKGHEELIAA